MIPALRRTIALPTYRLSIGSFILLLAVFSPTRSAWGQTVDRLQGSASKPPTWDELQLEIVQLQDEKSKVDAMLAENTKKIWRGTDEGLNGGAGALLEPVFGSPTEYKKIQQTLNQAAADAENSKSALQQAHAAFQSRQNAEAFAKAAEAAMLAREAETKAQDAYDQTAEVFKRVGGGLTGEMSPEDLLKLAHRFWKRRPDLVNAVNSLSQVGWAKDEQSILISIRYRLNIQIAGLKSLQAPVEHTSVPRVPVAHVPHTAPIPALAMNTSKQATRPDPLQSSKNPTSASGSRPVTAGPYNCVSCSPASSGPIPVTDSRHLPKTRSQNADLNESVQSIDDALRQPRQITLSPIPEVQSSSAPAGTSTAPVTGNDRGLRVEKITDPILPTKILILNQPAPTEIGLQNPLASSRRIPSAGQQSTPGTDPSGGIAAKQGQNYRTDDSVDKEIKQGLEKALKTEDGQAAKVQAKKP